MFKNRRSAFTLTLLASVFALDCGGSSSGSHIDPGAGASSVAGFGAGGALSSGGVGNIGGLDIDVPNPTSGGAMTSGGVTGAYPDTLPPGFTAANTSGGYKLGEPLEAVGDAGASGIGNAGAPGQDGCGTTILAVIRDFHADHENFEGGSGDDRMLVKPDLGPDRKPVFAPDGPTRTVGDPAQFADWYRNVDGLNKPYELEIWFAPKDGVTSFESSEFFPLDGAGFGNEGNEHNFHFTTEIHTQFKYGGGEKFNFTGDDDVWVFINSKLAIDLGGVHTAETASIDMDARAAELGLVKGHVYPFDMFQNERHTSQSNFRADTTLNFVDCGTIDPGNFQ